MKNCPTCGAQNADNAVICTNCAEPLATAIFCDNCGASNPPTEEYCVECGVNLHAKRQGPIAGAAPATTTQVLASQLAPGTYLSKKRYQIVRLLGIGGMGAVYEATDSHLGSNKVAIKEMNDAAWTDETDKKKAAAAFEQEAHLLSALSHPGLPRVTDYFSEDDKRYLVMDLVEGKTLGELISDRKQPFPETQVLDWALQLCDVLNYLHTRTPPIIYRDLKPGNIIVTQDGKSLRLVDFGIARYYKPGATRDTISLGTPGYAPPEQYGKAQTDGRADIYALGAVMHYLLTLRDPSADPFNFPPVTALNSQVSSETNDVVMCALQTDVSQRWSSAAEMKAALQPASGSLISAPSTGPVIGPLTPPPPKPAYTPPSPAPKPYTPPAPAYTPPTYVPPTPSGDSNVFDLGKAPSAAKISKPTSAAALKRSGVLGYLVGIPLFGILMLASTEFLVVRNGSFFGIISIYVANFVFALTAMVFLKRPGALILSGLFGLMLAAFFGRSSMAWISALEVYGAGELIFLLTLYRKFSFGIILISALAMVCAIIIFLVGFRAGFQVFAAQITAALFMSILAWLIGKIFKRI